MFLFRAKFLTRMPTAATTITPDSRTADAAKAISNNQLKSRLLLVRRAKTLAINRKTAPSRLGCNVFDPSHLKGGRIQLLKGTTNPSALSGKRRN